MKKTEIDLTQPVYITMNSTRSAWGISNDATVADRNAQARKTDRVHHYKVEDIHKSPLTPADLDFRRNGGLSYDIERDGYTPGSLLVPWVTQYGGIVYKGVMTKLVEGEWQPMNEMGRPVSNAALKAVKALKVFLLTPAVRKFLDANDPKAVEQAIEAIHANGYTLPKPTPAEEETEEEVGLAPGQEFQD